MQVSTTVVPARTGLAGHPSDAFGGAVLATPVPALAATVTVEPAPDGSVIVGDRSYADLGSLLASTHAGEPRLLTAAVARLVSWLGAAPAAGGFSMRWDSTIPRSVGLAGSSALVIGALRSLASMWGVAIPDEVGPRLALEVETELLGIAAGPQDRLVQWHGTTVLLELGSEPWEVSAVHPPEPIELLVCWIGTGRRPSHATHAPLQSRRDDPEVRRRMDALAALAREAAAAVGAGDLDALGRCLDDGFAHRQALVALDPAHVAIVDVLRGLGAAATYTGSGGAVVALAPDLEPLRRWASEAGLGHVTTTMA